MEHSDLLFGACACERNQYVVTIPRASRSQAHVFLDNSAANRRAQAAPVTAWLRIPLDWFQSTTIAHFADETHHSIRRTYYHIPAPPSARARAPPSSPPPPTRRQFCGYCGTHLTAWNEGRKPLGSAADALDVTLGSLDSESLDLLEALELLPGRDEEEEEQEEDGSGLRGLGGVAVTGTQGLRMGGMVDDEDHIPTTEPGQGETSKGLKKGGTVDDESHIPTNEPGPDDPASGLVKGGIVDYEDHIPMDESGGGVSVVDDTSEPGVGAGAVLAEAAPPQPLPPPANTSATTQLRHGASERFPHQLQHRGMPFFEELVEDSPLGRIRRRRGGKKSVDGAVSEEWEVVEIGEGLIGGDPENTVMVDVVPSKRLKTSR